MANIGDKFKAGEKVPHSGIYKVIHDPPHVADHEVTCIYGKQFPPCDHCGLQVRFELVHPARHILSHDHFRVKK